MTDTTKNALVRNGHYKTADGHAVTCLLIDENESTAIMRLDGGCWCDAIFTVDLGGRYLGKYPPQPHEIRNMDIVLN